MTQRIWKLLGAAVLLAFLTACGSVQKDGSRGEDGTGAPGEGAPAGGATSGGSGGQQPGAGQLTAGDWDDNRNFALFQKYLAEAAQVGQLPAHPSADRVVITVKDGQDRPVPNARVVVKVGAAVRLDAPTATDGRVLFLPTLDGAGAGPSSVTVTPPGQPGAAVTVDAPEGAEWTVALPSASAPLPRALDVAFVVDTTGSMGDELAYLKAELQAIVDEVRAAFPEVDARFALVVYRDDGDEYVVRTSDFTADLESFRAQLGAQQAGGGGDYPEAMERGLGAIHQLQWRTGDAARVTFLVADAPPHAEQARTFLVEANRARLAGIKVYPVAASGVAMEAEYLMRIAAQLTLGRYIFLTDDSGIGNAHEEPHIPCYQVVLLKKALVRALRAELSGVRPPLAEEDVIREVGQPQEGVCTLSDGTSAHL